MTGVHDMGASPAAPSTRPSTRSRTGNASRTPSPPPWTARESRQLTNTGGHRRVSHRKSTRVSPTTSAGSPQPRGCSSRRASSPAKRSTAKWRNSSAAGAGGNRDLRARRPDPGPPRREARPRPHPRLPEGQVGVDRVSARRIPEIRGPCLRPLRSAGTAPLQGGLQAGRSLGRLRGTS